MNPLQWLDEDRARARQHQDPYADLCALATVDARGNPGVRTLVLRNLDGRLAVFLNATSPKWPHMQRLAAVIFLASVNIQYRLACTTQPVPAERVHGLWQQRAEAPKKLDWLYGQRAQSSALMSREQLLEELAALDVPRPLVAPESARGLYLLPEEVERLDLNTDNGVHDRRHWRLLDGAWRARVLVP